MFLCIYNVLYWQVAAKSKYNTPTRCKPFVAATMLRRPEPIKERVEPATLSIIAIEILHSARFTLLLLLCRLFNDICGVIKSPHGLRLTAVTAIWTETRFGFPICVIFCNIAFEFDLDLKNLNQI